MLVVIKLWQKMLNVANFRSCFLLGRGTGAQVTVLKFLGVNSSKQFIQNIVFLRAFIGVETTDVTFITKQYSTSYSSHLCCCKLEVGYNLHYQT